MRGISQRPSVAVTVLIPAFNEAGTLPRLLEEVNRISLPRPYEILVVDDGSSDNVGAAVAEFPACRVERHPYNKGNGAAIKTGLRRARGEYVVVIDADLQHDPADIPALLERLKEYDLVVGCRQGGAGPALRNLGNRLLNRLASYLSGRDIADLTSGFRAFHRAKIAGFMHLYPNGFSFPATSTLAAISSGYDVTFVPVRVNPRRGGESKISLWRDGLRFPMILLRMINLFYPLKIFLPLGCTMATAGVLWTVRTYYLTGQVSVVAGVFFVCSFLCVLFGLLADQVSRIALEMGRVADEAGEGTSPDVILAGKT